MKMKKNNLPERIVCLTEETTETLYTIGAEDLIVGISQFVMRPKRAKKEKPIVSRYTDAKIDKIIAQKPDLVLAWSDLQADICAELIREGVNVMCFNHRTIDETLNFIERLGAMVGYYDEALDFSNSLRNKLDRAKEIGKARKIKPKVYFEEWHDPIITSISWVSELIEICGGEDVYAELSHKFHAKDRIVASTDEVIDKQADIMLASWCGKKFNHDEVISRKGWNSIPFVQNDAIYELPAEVILQPGPAALTDGLDMMMGIFDDWEKKQLSAKSNELHKVTEKS
jgi:iron complex transport system substrate-binding protein